MTDDEFSKKVEDLLKNFTAKVERDGGSTCAHCLREVPKKEIEYIGMFIPHAPGITGKHRLVAYGVCFRCWRLPEKGRAQKIEDNLVRSGIFLRPEDQGYL